MVIIETESSEIIFWECSAVFDMDTLKVVLAMEVKAKIYNQ